ncbi:MAG: L-histidine N(alpha)-methyltransferase [Candidatus Eremiobacteraeota bacterium]|nr:L-histidine N(alpha)-methyltransferase [Candidatus Eremiobacteraeota bacterium]
MSAMLTRVSDRLEIIAALQPVHIPSFAEDVVAGLTASQKTLPSKYFYDELGSVLFDAITVLPEYYLTRSETEILRRYGWEIVRSIGGPVELLELGSGSATKTRILIEEMLRVQPSLRYSPIDISPEALRASAVALVGAYSGLSITGYAADYFAILGTPQLAFRKRVLALFLGSNIGNYEPGVAARLLRTLAKSLRTSDGLLIGADLKKDRATLELAYDDPTGVTAAFNKNLLARINRELDADFDLATFRHIAQYDDHHGRVDSFLESTRAQQVRIGGLNALIDFGAGERIHTESSYKFSIEDIAAIGAEAGFELARTWMDDAGRFSVNLLTRS